MFRDFQTTYFFFSLPENENTQKAMSVNDVIELRKKAEEQNDFEYAAKFKKHEDTLLEIKSQIDSHVKQEDWVKCKELKSQMDAVLVEVTTLESNRKKLIPLIEAKAKAIERYDFDSVQEIEKKINELK